MTMKNDEMLHDNKNRKQTMNTAKLTVINNMAIKNNNKQQW